MGLSSLLGLFQGDPQFGVLSNVKSKPLAGRIGDLMGDWSANRTAGQQALSDYISKYMGGLKDSESRTSQEIGAIDPFYNGGMESTLAGLRLRREAAMNAAADVAANQAIRSAKLGQMASQGGPSSYDTRLMMSALVPIRTQAALDNASQARSDLDYLTGNQLALGGRRTALANAQAQYGLMPDQIRRSMYQSDVAGLSPLVQMDQANTFYGLQKKTTDLDRWQNFLGAQEAEIPALAGAAANAYSAFGGKGGGGGGSL